MTREEELRREKEFEEFIKAGMDNPSLIQEDVLRLRIENKGLKEVLEDYKQQNQNLIEMLKAEREVRVNDDYLKRVCELEDMIEKMRCCGNCSHFKTDNNNLYPVIRCEFEYLNRCVNKDKWELKEND